MKTLKKVLAVLLALAMVLGMTVVASATFTDAAEIGADYKEAVEVMNAVGVFVGSNGKMSPKANLTRAEAAKLVTYLLLGEDTAEALPVTAVYNDVPLTHWANKYIAYLSNEGIVAGVGAGKFNPTGNVTGYEFGKMLVAALGYNAANEGLTGSAWAINTAKLMKATGIVNATAAKKANLALTREEAAKYCLNALKATMVEYEDNGSSIKVGGVEIVTSASKAKEVTEAYNTKNSWAGKIATAKEDAQGNTVYTVELGEKLYDGKLVLVDVTSMDDFGRPAHGWEYKSEEIGTYADTADAVFTAATKESAVFAALDAAGKTAADGSKYVLVTTVYTNGKYNVTSPALVIEKGDTTTTVAGTGNGTIVEFFENATANEYTMVVIEEVLGSVSKVTAANESKGIKRSITIDGKKFETEDFAKDDKVVYTVARTAAATYKIESVAAVKEVVGKITANNSKAGTVVLGGKTYELAAIADMAEYATTNEDVTKYLDTYGYLVGSKVKTTFENSVVAVKDVYLAADSNNHLVYKADVTLADGTSTTWTVADDSAAAVYTTSGIYGYVKNTAKSGTTYTLNTFATDVEAAKNHVYAFEQSATLKASDKKITQTAAKTYYFAEDLKTIVLDTVDGEVEVYEGVKAFSTAQNAVFALVKAADGEELVQAIFLTGKVDNTVTTSDDLFYIAKDLEKTVEIMIDDDTYEYKLYDAYVGADKVTDFYASSVDTETKVGYFYTSVQDDETKGYDISEYNNYNAEGDTIEVSVLNGEDVLSINAQKGILTLDNADPDEDGSDLDLSGLEDAKLVDVFNTGDAKITTVAELKDALVKNDIEVSVIYNGKTGVLDWVYIESVEAREFNLTGLGSSVLGAGHYVRFYSDYAGNAQITKQVADKYVYIKLDLAGIYSSIELELSPDCEVKVYNDGWVDPQTPGTFHEAYTYRISMPAADFAITKAE